jgi:hypothetical protein
VGSVSSAWNVARLWLRQVGNKKAIQAVDVNSRSAIRLLSSQRIKHLKIKAHGLLFPTTVD